jgi:hypothetical protein
MALYKLTLDTKKANAGFVNAALAQGLASRNTLNIIAALTAKNYKKNADDELILRSTFTKRNIRFEKTRFVKIKRQVTKAGATDRASYMELQEKGGIKKTKTGANLAMAQKAARGGSNKRKVLKAHYLRKIQRQTVRYPKGGTSKKARVIAAASAAYNKNLFMNYSQNIYKITSFNKINGRVRFQKRHIYNVSQRSARIKSRAMLWPATKKPVRDAQNIFNSQVKKMLRQKNII